MALILAVGPILGCGIINPHRKNFEGYYDAHYRACGPQALEKAFYAFFKNQGAAFKKGHTRQEISRSIQSQGMLGRELLSFFHKDAIQITWPSEIKKIAGNYGFDLVTVDSLSSLDPQKDIAIVLIHGKFFSDQYHWVVYPIDDVEGFYGKKTVIDKIYLLKWKGD